MPTPATTGQLRTSVKDMQIGDYIACWYTPNTSKKQAGHFEKLGNTTVTTEIPVSGVASGTGIFYFIKVTKGLLISDRVLRHSISWDTLNADKYIQGVKAVDVFNDVENPNIANGIIRSLTGGVAYADANGNKSTTDLGYGAFPTNNEWDKFIVNFPQELIQSGKTLDDVFHWSNCRTWTQDTPIISWYSSIARIVRGYTSNIRYVQGYASSTNSSNIGFRPVFEYIES